MTTESKSTIPDMTELPKQFITIQYAISGYMAVHVHTNCEDIEGECFHEPYNIGFGRYDNAEAAWVEARAWADDEQLPLVNDPEAK